MVSPQLSSARRERDRVRAEYRRRDADPRAAARYALDRPWVAYEAAALDAALRDLLLAHDVLPLSAARVLEVGCGPGVQLQRFVRLGAAAGRLWGIDLSASRLQRACARVPGAHLVEADASELPFASGIFDVVAQFTTLSSILDPAVRAAAAAEMRRVARPGGALISYDMRVPAPRSATRPIDRAEIARLFPGLDADVRNVTLVPALSRVIAPRAPGVAALLARVPLLRTHHVALLRAPAAPPRR